MELPVMLAAFYGLRRSEVIGLQWSAIDFERKIVTISRTFERINVDGKMVDVSKCRTKNKASFRSLPLIPAVEQALLKAQKRQHQQMKLCGGSYCKEYKDYICVDDMGHLVTPDYVTRVFREMLVKNGFRPIRYHDLRPLLRQLAYQEQSHNERGADVVGAFQLFHHSQYLRPHRRGQQDGSREHDCQQNQPWRTSRKKEISQAKNCLGEKLRWANLSAKTNGK